MHLFREHSLEKYLYPSQRIALKIDQTTESKIDKKKKSELDKSLIDCVIEDGRCFVDFGKDGMSKFPAVAIPGYKPPCRQTIAKNLSRFADYFQSLKENLLRIKKISLTLDMSRSKNLVSFLTITAHFFDKNLRYFSLVISYKQFNGQHLSRKIEDFINKELT